MSTKNTAGAAVQENKMGVLPVGKLLAGMAIPMMMAITIPMIHIFGQIPCKPSKSFRIFAARSVILIRKTRISISIIHNYT